MENKERYYRSYIFLVLGFILGLILGFASASAHTGHEESHDYMGRIIRELGQGKGCNRFVVREYLKKWLKTAHASSPLTVDEVHLHIRGAAHYSGADKCKAMIKEVLGPINKRIVCHYADDKEKEKKDILCSLE